MKGKIKGKARRLKKIVVAWQVRQTRAKFQITQLGEKSDFLRPSPGNAGFSKVGPEETRDTSTNGKLKGVTEPEYCKQKDGRKPGADQHVDGKGGRLVQRGKRGPKGNIGETNRKKPGAWGLAWVQAHGGRSVLALSRFHKAEEPSRTLTAAPTNQPPRTKTKDTQTTTLPS